MSMSGVAIESRDLGPEPADRAGLDRLDPRTRLIAALAFIIAVVATTNLAALGIAILLALGLAALTGQRPRALGRRLAHVEGFVVVLFMLLPVTVPGDPLFAVGPFVATDAGVLRTVTLALKINAAVIGLFALLGSIEPARLGGALARLRAPGALVQLLLFTIRFAALFRGEIQRTGTRGEPTEISRA
jgi:cobalt/nickel transport system permease protein